MSLLFTRQKITIPPEIVYLSRENVVMHVSSKPDPKRSLMRIALGQSFDPPPDAASSITQTGNLPLKTFTIADHDSPFSHMRITTPNDGKVKVYSAVYGIALPNAVLVSCVSKTKEHYQGGKTHPCRRVHVNGTLSQLERTRQTPMAVGI